MSGYLQTGDGSRHYRDICHTTNKIFLGDLFKSLMFTEDTSLLLTLVAVISGAVVIMAVLLIVLHCRRLRVRTKGLGDKVTEAAENFTDQEIWPGHEAGEGDMAASELKVSALEKSALLRIIKFN